ncbi:hypothetical protein EV715DRAFT_274111 [Schizophyllum commune]
MRVNRIRQIFAAARHFLPSCTHLPTCLARTRIAAPQRRSRRQVRARRPPIHPRRHTRRGRVRKHISGSGERAPPQRPPRKTCSSTRRGEIACAECRRLKVKCDRTIPCSTCVKRGCAALCPNGTIPPGEGSRFVLAATEHLEHRRATMEARMHALEDALAILHSTQSDDTHPLLLESLEEEPFEPSPEDLAADQEASGTQAEEALPTRSVGALHMDELGSSRFYGPSGGSEDLDVPSTRAAPQELDPTYLGPEINNAYNSFPFTPPGMAVSAVQSAIESFLPSVERAVTLIDTMLEHLSWMFRIVSRAEIMNTVLPAVYKQDSSLTYGPHELSLLLSVLALGALVDLNQGPYNLEAQHYYHLTRAAISLQPVLTDQSMATVKTLHLMSLYNGMSGQESALEPTYNLLSMAGQAALPYTHGADIDPSMWQFTGQEAYERRAYFWNLLAAIMWQSLVTGRPPIILSTFIDCRIPTSEEEELYQEGEVPVGFGVWGYRASVACLVPLVLTTLSTNTPSYAKILEVDKQIRDFFGVARDSTAESERTSAAMRVFVRSHYEDLMMLFLHRGCFAEAMAYPNPLRSPYAPSVQAAYKSACIVLADTQEHYAKNPMLLSRVWRIWSNAFSAAVVVGTVARKGVQLSGMPDPFEQLDSAVELFRKASGSSSRAERGLVSTSMISPASRIQYLSFSPYWKLCARKPCRRRTPRRSQRRSHRRDLTPSLSSADSRAM